MKELNVLIASIVLLVSIAGCSDQPNSGIITITSGLKYIGENDEGFSIKTVTGNVYGYSPNIFKAYADLKHDKDELERFERRVWEYAIVGGKKPELTLTYNGVPKSDLVSAVSFVFSKAQLEYSEGMFSKKLDLKTLESSLSHKRKESNVDIK
jgi:hypothetical protein